MEFRFGHTLFTFFSFLRLFFGVAVAFLSFIGRRWFSLFQENLATTALTDFSAISC